MEPGRKSGYPVPVHVSHSVYKRFLLLAQFHVFCGVLRGLHQPTAEMSVQVFVPAGGRKTSVSRVRQ